MQISHKKPKNTNATCITVLAVWAWISLMTRKWPAIPIRLAFVRVIWPHPRMEVITSEHTHIYIYVLNTNLKPWLTFAVYLQMYYSNLAHLLPTFYAFAVVVQFHGCRCHLTSFFGLLAIVTLKKGCCLCVYLSSSSEALMVRFTLTTQQVKLGETFGHCPTVSFL
jgi:hypothetical protein